MGRDLPWKVSGESHRLGTPVLGSHTGEQAPLAGQRASGTNRRTVGTLDSAREELSPTGLLLRQHGEGGERFSLAAAGFPTTALACTPA